MPIQLKRWTLLICFCVLISWSAGGAVVYAEEAIDFWSPSVAARGEDVEDGLEAAPTEYLNSDAILKPISVEFSWEAAKTIFQANGYSEGEINSWYRIFDKESKFNPLSEAPTEVKHCERPNGSFYAVELKQYPSGGWWQAYCNAGDVEVYAEKSFGLTHILPSTWKRTGCEGDKWNWMAQVECSIKIQRQTNFTSWTTY